MGDYVVSAKITGDSSGLVKASADAVTAVNSVGEAAKGAAPSTSALAAAIKQVQDATNPATGSTAALKAAVASAKQQLDAGALSGDAYAKVLQVAARNGAEFERLQRLVNKSVSDGAGSMGSARLAQFELLHVVTASSDALNAGIPISRVFATEIGRVGEAAVFMSGSLGSVGKYLSGGYGLAVMLGVGVLGTLISKIHGSSDALGDEVEKLKDNAAKTRLADQAKEAFGRTSEGATEALRRETDELDRQNRTLDDNIRLQVQKLRQQRDTASQRLSQLPGDEAQAQRDLAAAKKVQADLAASAAGVGHGAEAASGQLAAADQEVQAYQQKLKDLVDEHNRLIEAVNGANRAIREAQFPLAERQAKEAVDPIAALNRKYDDMAAAAKEAAKSNDDLSKALAGTLTNIERQRKAALDAAKQAAETAHQIGATMTLAQGEALIHSIGGTVTSGQRSFATQQRLYQRYLAGTGPLAAKPGTSYHEVGQALDIAKTTGMTLAKIRDAFRDAGVPVKELLDEGDHFHVAWGKAADTAKVAAQAINELNQELSQIITKFDPMLAASNDFLHTLQQIHQLAPADNFFNPGGKGKISATQADQYEFNAANAYAQSLAQIQDQQRSDVNDFFKQQADIYQHDLFDPLIQNMVPVVVKAGRDGGHAFGDEAARAVGDLVGGKLGNILGGVMSVVSGSTAGLRQSGPLGDVLALLTAKPREGQQLDPLTTGLQDFAQPIKKGLNDLLGVFKIGGDFEKTLGHMAGGAALGSLVGPGIVSLFGGHGSNVGGAIGGALGEAAGKAFLTPLLTSVSSSLGSFAGPIGAVAGSILGSVIGGLFKPAPKTGGAVVTSTTGASQTVGNDATSISAASGSATSIQSALGQIAQQLGGTLGAFKISIGEANGQWSVDPLGLGRSAKPGGGATGFGQDEQAAVEFAIQQAIAQGAVGGLSQAMQQALKSSPDINQALAEALKVQQVQDLLKDMGSGINKTFRDFETQAADRLRIAKQYGFDVVEIDKINAQQRLALEKQTLQQTVGSLQTLLSDLATGDLSEGSLVDQIGKIKDQLTGTISDAMAGVDGAADQVAELERNLIDKTKAAFGTAGPELAAAEDQAKSTAEQIIQAEQDRIKAAEDAAKATNDALNENNDQNAVMIQKLTNIEGLLGGGAAGAGGLTLPSYRISTAFSGQLTL